MIVERYLVFHIVEGTINDDTSKLYQTQEDITPNSCVNTYLNQKFGYDKWKIDYCLGLVDTDIVSWQMYQKDNGFRYDIIKSIHSAGYECKMNFFLSNESIKRLSRMVLKCKILEYSNREMVCEFTIVPLGIFDISDCEKELSQFLLSNAIKP